MMIHSCRHEEQKELVCGHSKARWCRLCGSLKVGNGTWSRPCANQLARQSTRNLLFASSREEMLAELKARVESEDYVGASFVLDLLHEHKNES